VRLVDPDTRYHRSYLAALAELAEAGEERYAEPPSWSAEEGVPAADFTPATLHDEQVFADFVGFLLAQRDPEAPRPRAYVAFTELWIVQDGEYLGRISLRHELNDLLHEWGGHIGYVVRPSARRQGYASAALAQMLTLCRERGMAEVLVTCDVDNVASRRIIEGNGGRYEDTRMGKRRYWIPLGG
jgi:predicted acetyltransferase